MIDTATPGPIPDTPRTPVLDALVVGDDPGTWVAAGFAVDADGTCRIGGIRVVLAGPGPDRGIRSWSWQNLPPGWSGALDGLATTPATAPATAAPADRPATHPNGATNIDHVVVLSPDVDRTVRALAGIGLSPRRERQVPGPGADPHRVVHRQVFFRVGDVILELVGPATRAEDRRADPAGFFGVAVTVADLDRACQLLGEACGPAHDAVQEGRRIASLRPGLLGMSVPVALMSAPVARATRSADGSASGTAATAH